MNGRRVWERRSSYQQVHAFTICGISVRRMPAFHPVQVHSSRHTRLVEYHQAFPDLAGVYLEDSWVLNVAPTEHGVSFRLEAVLTPEHPRYRPRQADEQYCYLTGWLSVRSSEPVEVRLSGLPPAIDVSGEQDLGNIDRFVLHAGEVWAMEGDWGSARVAHPEVSLRFE